eukprot:5082283-Prymnesium_polylepis.1
MASFRGSVVGSWPVSRARALRRPSNTPGSSPMRELQSRRRDMNPGRTFSISSLARASTSLRVSYGWQRSASASTEGASE